MNIKTKIVNDSLIILENEGHYQFVPLIKKKVISDLTMFSKPYDERFEDLENKISNKKANFLNHNQLVHLILLPVELTKKQKTLIDKLADGEAHYKEDLLKVTKVKDKNPKNLEMLISNLRKKLKENRLGSIVIIRSLDKPLAGYKLILNLPKEI